MRKFIGIAAAALLGAASPATAAVSLITNGSGQLTGATGVTIGGATYDVTFADGSCASLFGGCDSASDLDFPNESDATAAAQALIDQVFTGAFDSDYTLTFGCSANASDFGSFCAAFVPYQIDGTHWSGEGALNTNVNDQTFGTGGDINFDTTSAPQFVFALFSPSAIGAVPEPSTWAMMLLGFFGIGVAVRRQARAPAAA